MQRLTKNSTVTLVELPPTQFGRLNGEPSQDFYGAIRLPSRAIPALAAVLIADGWRSISEINPIYHGTRGKLDEANFSRIFASEVLLISSITRTSAQSMRLAGLYKARNPDGIVIAGGPDATFRIEDWLRHTDVVVRGEGEETLRELMDELTKEGPDLKAIDGIAFKDNGAIVLTGQRRLMTAEELSMLPHPYYDGRIRRKVKSIVLEASRGCPNNCDFCSVTQMYGSAYRQKSIQYVIEELEAVEKIGSFCFFTDDNIAANPGKTIELMEEMRKRSVSRKKIAQITIASAFDDALLRALKNAGFQYLCVGIESIVDETLEFLGKPYKADRIKAAIHIYRQNGFWVHGMMIVGGDGDTREALDATEHWIGKNLDSVQLFTPIPLPGTRFYERMEKEGRILTRDWYLYDGQHVVIRPTAYSPYWLQERLLRMYRRFYSPGSSLLRAMETRKVGMNLLFSLYAHTLGRGVFSNPQLAAHMGFLRTLS